VLFARWIDLCLVSTKSIITRTFRKIGPHLFSSRGNQSFRHTVRFTSTLSFGCPCVRPISLVPYCFHVQQPIGAIAFAYFSFRVERSLMSPRRPRGGGVNRPAKILLKQKLKLRAALPSYNRESNGAQTWWKCTWDIQWQICKVLTQNSIRLEGSIASLRGRHWRPAQEELSIIQNSTKEI